MYEAGLSHRAAALVRALCCVLRVVGSALGAFVLAVHPLAHDLYSCHAEAVMPVQSAGAMIESASSVAVKARNSRHLVKERPYPRVLVVDDEPLVRWSVAETLGARGYEVIEAGCGESAVRAFINSPGPPDVVLLDLLLPDVCDLSLLTAFRRLAPTVPIIMMTAFATPELVERARTSGAYTVVNKPFELNELAPLIRQALLTMRPS
jgi:CheY-like chemotaxis protein